MLYLAGDIGGTNCRLLLVEVDEKDVRQGDSVDHERIVDQHTYPSAKYSSLIEIIHIFLARTSADIHPETCVLAVAGPVDDNRCYVTNLHWQLDGRAMAKELDVRSVLLLNDFVAIGYGLLALKPHEKEELSMSGEGPTPVQHDRPIACIGAGTGLGETFLTCSNGRYTVFPSEGGHASFASKTQEQYELVEFIKAKHKYVAYIYTAVSYLYLVFLMFIFPFTFALSLTHTFSSLCRPLSLSLASLYSHLPKHLPTPQDPNRVC